MADVASSALLESKLVPPPVRPTMVARSELIKRLLSAPETPILSITAPPGYGKTTLLAQWAAEHGRVAWVTVDERDNDPAVLLSYIAHALNRVEPVDPELFRAFDHPGSFLAGTAVPRLAAALAAMHKPIALVLDHVELLQSQNCLDAVAELALNLPPGCQLAMGSRGLLPLPAATLRAKRAVLELGPVDLALDEDEARALVANTGMQLADDVMGRLIERTEGWAAGLSLAVAAVEAGATADDAAYSFTGDDRLMADYLRSELLTRLSRPMYTFLTRTSVLERLSGPLCDSVLDASDSAPVLASLEASNLLLVPLDRKRQWYRYHALFRDLLRSELERNEPDLVPELHRRASAWCETHDLHDLAIAHAQAIGDNDRVAALVTPLILPTYARGREDTVATWLEWFVNRNLVESHPALAVPGAMFWALSGNPGRAEQWATAAERGALTGTMPDGSTAEGWLTQLRASLARDGIKQAERDCEAALTQLAPGSQLRGQSQAILGFGALLRGDADEAQRRLELTVDVSAAVGATGARAVAHTCLATIARDRGDWDDAATHIDRALEIIRDEHLDEYAASSMTYAVAAGLALHRSDVPRAKEMTARAARLRPMLTYAMPHLSVVALLELANTYLALADPAGARTVLREVRAVLRQRLNLGLAAERCEALERKIETMHADAAGASALTAAELRLLPMLSTHLSFREIGERLHVSRHTVKTQAMSVYQKLGVSSRSDAITRVREIGLLAS